MSYAARAMRGLVIDHARRARAHKRGGGAFETALADTEAGAPASGMDANELESLSDHSLRPRAARTNQSLDGRGAAPGRQLHLRVMPRP